jgi:hypothetical protein
MKRALPLLLLLFQVFLLTQQSAYAQNSTIVRPANGDVVPTSGFTVEVAPNASASQRVIYITDLSTNTLYSQSAPQYGTGTITYNVPPGLKPSTSYRVQVTSWTAAGIFNTSVTVTTNSAPAPAPAPVVLSPTPGAVVPTNGFTVRVAANQYATQTDITVTNLATNTVYARSPSYYTTGEISYVVPPALSPNTPYRISVTSRTSFGVYTTTVDVTTDSTPAPSAAPVILSPAQGAIVSTTGFTVRVAANQFATQTNITVTDLSDNSVYTSSPPYYTTGEISFVVPPALSLNTQYRISVTARTTFGIFTTSITVTTDNTPATSPTPRITSPANGTYVLAPGGFAVEVAPNSYATQVNIRVTNLNNNTTYATSSFNTTSAITYVVPAGLAPNTRYQVTVSAFTPFGLRSSSVTVSTFLPSTFLTLVDGQNVDANNLADVRYANEFSYSIGARPIQGADQYVWELGLDNTFSSIAYSATTATPTLPLTAITLTSGQKYFVRVRGVRTETGAVSDASPPREFYNALHPMTYVFPVGDWTERSFGLHTGAIVENSTEWIFQMAIADNDGDPNNDFDPEKIFSNPFPYGGNGTFPGVNGNVFRANRTKPIPGGTQAVFSYVWAQPKTAYRVRMRAARTNANGVYLQRGYWSPAVTITTNAVPDRVHPIINIANGETNVENRLSQRFTRIYLKGMALQWDITAYQLQVSESADFTTGVITLPDDASILNRPVGGVTQGDPVIDVPDLKFATTYYARARSLATVNGVANVSSAWSPVTRFTTKAAPTGRTAFEAGQGAQSHPFGVENRVSPNPFAGSTTLKLGASYPSQVQLRVVDNLGREVANRTVSGGEEVILGAGWPKGLYLIQIDGGNGLRETIRVVKQ